LSSYEAGSFNYQLGYVDPSDVSNKDLLQMMDWFYNSNYPSNASLWMQGAIDMRFKVGDQGLYNQVYGNNNTGDAQRFFFNLIRRHINMVCGYQRKNRKSTISMPIHDQDDALADDINRVFRYCENRDGFQEYLSEAFEGSCSTGMTLLNMYLDFTNDPISGDIFTDAVPYNDYLIDQFFKKQDLSDCNGIWRRKWTSKTIAKGLLPGYEKEIDKMKPGGQKDGKFPVQAELNNVAMSNLFTYDQMCYRTTRPGKIILDPYTGESAEWEDNDEDEKDLMQRVLQQQPWLTVKEVQIPTVKMIIKLSDHVVYHGKNQLGIDSYPYVPSICYYEPNMKQFALRCMGIIRNARDSQFLYNMRKVIELKLLQSSVNAGWIFPVDVVTDMKAFRQNDGGSGFLIPLKSGRLPSEIQRIEPVAIPQSLLELSNSLAEDITRITGINEELLGAATDDKSGILSMLRQGAGLVTLQTIFDKLDYTQRLYGDLRYKVIRKNFSKGKIRNILGKDPDPRFFSAAAQRFSIAVEEGNYSTTQKQMELQQLLHFKELGLPIPDKSILRAAFITDKKQIIEDMAQQNEQQQQAQQQQAQLDQQKIQAEVMGLQAKSQVDMAKQQDLHASVAERFAKIQDLQASAEHKSSQSDLDMVRTMIELEDMDLQNFRNNLELAEYIKAQNKLSQQPIQAGV
jgi:hypothetical protein